jgi:hypothetical protein
MHEYRHDFDGQRRVDLAIDEHLPYGSHVSLSLGSDYC